MTTIQMYKATVIVTFDLQVSGTTQDEADQSARRAACGRPGIRAADVRDVVLIPMTAVERMKADNIRTWQEIEALKLGTDSQRSRWSGGILPDEELLQLARAELFQSFAPFKRWRRMPASEIPHPGTAIGNVRPCLLDSDHISWTTTDNPTLSPTEWETVQLMRVAVAEAACHAWLRDTDDPVRIFLREHTGRCGTCHRTASRHSASIQIQWAQRTLTYEFAL